jgi:hypothetical protein
MNDTGLVYIKDHPIMIELMYVKCTSMMIDIVIVLNATKVCFHNKCLQSIKQGSNFMSKFSSLDLIFSPP